jgi:FkbM family methyltransferase
MDGITAETLAPRTMVSAYFFRLKVTNVWRVLASPAMLLRFVRWTASRLMLGRTPLITIVEGVRVGEFASFSEYWIRRGGLDAEDLETIFAVTSALAKPSTAVDVGANLGMFSLALAYARFELVQSFEPVPDTFERFRSNIARNRKLAHRIVANNRAVGNVDGKARLVIYPSSPGQNKIATTNQLTGSVQEISVPIVTLDSYFAPPGRQCPSFIKIDVEGFETDVLKGASSLLRSGVVRYIYAEVIDKALNETGSSISEFANMLNDLCFQAVVVEGGRISDVPLDEALLQAGPRRNVLFRRR